jgi:multiple sugar transport system permease protein
MTRTAALRPTARADRAATRRGRRPGRRQWAWAYLMIAPMTIDLSVFYLWPIAQTFYCSFTTSGPFGRHTWTGTANYNALTGDPTVSQAVVNTLLYTVIQLAGIPFAILVAALLNQKNLRGRLQP